MKRTLTALLLSLASVALTVACSDKPKEDAAATKPVEAPAPAPVEAKPAVAPDAGPVAPVRSAMWNMAAKTNRIAALLALPPPVAPAKITEAKALMDDVAKIAAGLAVDETALKHPKVKEGLPEFQKALAAAQAGLAKEPPDTWPATRLGESCQECHGMGKSAPPFEL